MTLIGPRPERPAFCEEFEKRIHGWHYRTMVTPGLSGLAQVTGGYDLLPKEKVVLDLWQKQIRLSLCPPIMLILPFALCLGNQFIANTMAVAITPTWGTPFAMSLGIFPGLKRLRHGRK